MTPALSFRSVARTHVGHVRELNEDNFLDRPQIGLWAVADGMGGHQAGEVASALVVEALARIDPASSGHAYLTAVGETLQAVNNDLVSRAARDPAGGAIGATVVTLLAYERHYACLWAGDSRAYLLRGGVLRQITHDHSLVQELVDAGDISRQQARTDRRAHVITRAVGVRAPLDLDVRYAPVEAGDLFLLCSDGLTGLVEDHEIRALMLDGDLDQIADALLSITLRRGARDNVTVVLVKAE